MTPCHYCEENPGEHECPTCHELTCEDCFEPMTQFNAGHDIPCLACSGKQERSARAEHAREDAILRQAAAAKEDRRVKARTRYYSTEAIERRNQKRWERQVAKGKARSVQAAAIAEIIKKGGFFG